MLFKIEETAGCRVLRRCVRSLLTGCLVGMASIPVSATSYNIAPHAKIVASSELAGKPASAVADGIIGIPEKGEWASAAEEMFWGEKDHPSITLEWDKAVWISRVVLYDRAGEDVGHTAAATLTFDDGSRVDVGEIPISGRGRSIEFVPRLTSRIEIEVIDSDGSFPGFSEIEVFPSPSSAEDFVSLVDPYIETARGRYFFFATGSLPTGMMSAAPMTRNKNQGGGGYNYNDGFILGFPQIHAWMLSGLSVLPADGAIDCTQGEAGWKSAFSHATEIVRPGYHRVFLDKYGVWVEQTVTERTSHYRMRYDKDVTAAVIMNLGGYLGTSTMVEAKVEKEGSRRLVGSFNTTGRLWGGPENVEIYFVADFDRDFEGLDGWDGDKTLKDIEDFSSTGKAVARNEGMSYYDAPTAGVLPKFALKAGEDLQMKIAISYVSVENAKLNMEVENPGWDFDKVHSEATATWNSWLGRIVASGGSDEQRVKFYTDLWHTLLGRHKIDDVNGEYPDRTGGRIDGRKTFCDGWKVGKVDLDKTGKQLHHMYNSDALWLTQWNQNTLWGLAYPDLLDDFCASLLKYAETGKLIPRGPCGGGYSFIMSGCPATSMVTSAFQQGVLRKWNPRKAMKLLISNHEEGGMLGFNFEDEFRFYVKNGYAPEKAGLTVQWTFEDWALSQMCERLGNRKDAKRLLKRSQGWRALVHPELHLILPKKVDGSWLHTDPLSGWGFEEANSWQTTFGLSHDLPGLIREMGGEERFCEMLNYAFEQSKDLDFTGSYGNGYVSYANQPGLSTAHVFSYAGRPDLTWHWVREVNNRAYGAVTPYRGYGGHDEDQGQMSGVSALMSMGLFSVNGCSAQNPWYELTIPVFDKITVMLHPDYYAGEKLEIEVEGDSSDVRNVKEILWNGKPLNDFRLPHRDATGGGSLKFKML